LGEERELHIPIRLNYYLGDNDDTRRETTFENRNTWPINSDNARRLRREFVQEGFRRLYRSAASSSSLDQNRITGADGPLFGGTKGEKTKKLLPHLTRWDQSLARSLMALK
jgi:hypothetical protein